MVYKIRRTLDSEKIQIKYYDRVNIRGDAWGGALEHMPHLKKRKKNNCLKRFTFDFDITLV